MVNLTKNALKFSQGKSVKIRAAYDKMTEMLVVHVIDKGQGISEEEMGNLFKLFGKLERTTDLNIEGTGIGLTICQKIVKNNKGAIDVFS